VYSPPVPPSRNDWYATNKSRAGKVKHTKYNKKTLNKMKNAVLQV
jgi:hypothetical protein